MTKEETPATDVLRGIRAICFDLDNTLYDREAAARAIFTRWLAEAPPSAPTMDEILERDGGGHSSRRDLFGWLGERLGRPDLWDDYRREFRCVATLPIESRTLLETLRRRNVPRAILTNGGPGQRDKVGFLGLLAYFSSELVFVTSEIGVDKPDPRTFASVAGALDLPPGRILFVGDHPDFDIRGAKEAGFQTCWIRRDPAHHSDHADFVTNSLADLAGLAATIPPDGT